ncbi:hypothetical protein PQR65_12360 [Paraburkholderia nemoris]|uniref:hypothetical protein n=1 Tax=Paraburkholderia nemoris TaxID=2793076 RepID=UPI0038B80E9C
MQLASGQMTPKDDRKPITVQCKIYWIHQHEWNAQWIAQYHAAAPSLAKEIQARKVDMSKLDSEPIDGSPTGGNEANRFTCEDFAFELLIEFASRNKLPLKIKTEAATFKNIDKDYKSGNKSAPPTPAGFALDVAYASGAPDVLKNASPVADSDLLPGDLFVEFNGGHIQVVTGASPSKIDIMQGNFPGPGETPKRKWTSYLELGPWLRSTNDGNRESSNYLGAPVQDASYEQRGGKWMYQRHYGNYQNWDSDVWGTMSKHVRWNFAEFNNL